MTFVTTISFLEMQNIDFGGRMVAVMALMEAPSILVGMLLISFYSSKKESTLNLKDVTHHSLTNGSVVLIIGSLLAGYLANDAQAEEIKPFTTDLFKGFLAVFFIGYGYN